MTFAQEQAQAMFEALVDYHDFISAIADATAGGNIDKDSVMRHGERLKTTAKNLAAKTASVIQKSNPNAPTTQPFPKGRW